MPSEEYRLITVCYKDDADTMFYSNLFREDTLESIDSEITKETEDRYKQKISFEEELEGIGISEKELLEYMLHRFKEE